MDVGRGSSSRANRAGAGSAVLYALHELCNRPGHDLDLGFLEHISMMPRNRLDLDDSVDPVLPAKIGLGDVDDRSDLALEDSQPSAIGSWSVAPVMPGPRSQAAACRVLEGLLCRARLRRGSAWPNRRTARKAEDANSTRATSLGVALSAFVGSEERRGSTFEECWRRWTASRG